MRGRVADCAARGALGRCRGGAPGRAATAGARAQRPPPTDPRRRWETIGEGTLELAVQWLQEARALARQIAPTVESDGHLRFGEPATELLAESWAARLIVAGARGDGGFPGLELGTVALALATAGHCPAVIVRDRPLETGPRPTPRR